MAALAASAIAPVALGQPRAPANGARATKYPVSGAEGPGWTSFSASPDTQVIYVSFSMGNDSNSGLSPQSPVRTLAEGYSRIRNGFPDWLLLKRGDAWSASIPEWLKGGRSESEPVILGSYGEGPRPRLDTGSSGGFFTFAAVESPLAHLAVMDIHFTADRGGGTSPDAGITVLNDWRDVLIENCLVEGYRDNIVVEEIKARPRDIRIRRCVIVDSYSSSWFSQGLYVGAVDGMLIEENLFDHNGWRRGVPGAHATVFNHNMYLHGSCTGIVTRGNITARAGATGISQRCAGISEENLALQNPTGIFYAGDNLQQMPGGRGAIRNNVILDARDIDSQNLRGFGIAVGGAANVEVYGNIIAHQNTGTGNVAGIDAFSSLTNVLFARNIVHNWTIDSYGVGMLLDFRLAVGVQVTDSAVSQPMGGFVVAWVRPAGAEFSGVFGRGSYFTSNAWPHQFYYGMTYEDWLISSQEVWSEFDDVTYPAPERDIASYISGLGYPATLESFLFAARQQDRASWNDDLTAGAVCRYIREGFGVSRSECRADFNRDGSVNAQDLADFGAAVGAGSPLADMDLDGLVNQFDQMLFQDIFAAGCP